MFGLLKHVIKDVSVLYRNFIYWNVSKISIFSRSFLIALAIIIPFLFITFLIFIILGVDWYAYTGHFYNGTLTLDMKGHKDYYIWFFLGGINLIIFGLGWMYSKVMYFDLNIKLLDGKKEVNFNKLDFISLISFGILYLNMNITNILLQVISLFAFIFLVIYAFYLLYTFGKKIIKYYKISLMILLFLLVPIIFLLISMSILVLASGGTNAAGVEFTNGNTFLAITSLFLYTASIVSGLYILYRTCFAYILLVDKGGLGDKKCSAKNMIKESFKRTKGFKKPFKFVSILLLFLIIIAFTQTINQGLNNTHGQIKDFQIFQSISEDNKVKLKEYKPYYYAELELKYNNISAEDLEKNIQIYNNFINFYSILIFLFISGMTEMFLVSFYKRELTHK